MHVPQRKISLNYRDLEGWRLDLIVSRVKLVRFCKVNGYAFREKISAGFVFPSLLTWDYLLREQSLQLWEQFFTEAQTLFESVLALWKANT